MSVSSSCPALPLSRQENGILHWFVAQAHSLRADACKLAVAVAAALGSG
ncbi:MAG: hypothetical protein ACXVRW_12570 [Solirubrobacteraceae bacterium]